VSFDPISAAAGLAIEAISGGRPSITHLSGVYHQRAYHMTGERRDRAVLNRLVASAVGFDRLYFQNRETRRDHERLWRRCLGGSPIVPLAVNVHDPCWRASAGQPLRIVSVGRLVDFKAYNLGAFEIVRDCRTRGLDVRWDIYGSGPLAEEMARLAVEHDVADAVAIKGELPYPDYVKTVTGYDLFVGCGTAALEAAMTGMPVLAVTDSERRATYGFLHELPFGNTGELQEYPPHKDLGQLIAAYAMLDADGRAELGRKSREAALAYGMPAMIERLEAMAGSRPAAPSRLRKRLISALYDVMTIGPAARLARRVQAAARR
jgi:glycosyltransferase involved in cell wall biosynthesis